MITLLKFNEIQRGLGEILLTNYSLTFSSQSRKTHFNGSGFVMEVQKYYIGILWGDIHAPAMYFRCTFSFPGTERCDRNPTSPTDEEFAFGLGRNRYQLLFESSPGSFTSRQKRLPLYF